MTAACLIGVGATTGVGGTAAVSMAAFRAGLTRTERVGYGAEDDAWSHAVRVGTLEEADPEKRARALLHAAVAQAWAPLRQAARGLRIGIYQAGAAGLGERVARQLGVEPQQLLHAGEHASAGLCALRQAWSDLGEQNIDVALVVGVGVESSARALRVGREQGRVLGGESSFGTVPGEAAVALALCSERVREQLSVRSRGRLIAVASAEEKTPFGGPLPCVGNGLIEAIRAALGSLPAGERLATVLCDLNGERARADEWGFAVPRLSQRLVMPSRFITPISAFGDSGAPTGLLLVALASALGKNADGDRRALIWTSSAGSARAAALFEAADGAASGAPPAGAEHGRAASGAGSEPASPPVPGWALALDASVLGELVDEAAFRHDQRQYELGKAESEPAGTSQQALARVEAVLDQIVGGLLDCGPRAWQRVEAALVPPAPGALYTAVRVLCEAGHMARALPIVLEHGGAASALGQATRLGLLHAAPNGAALKPAIEACLDGSPALATLGLSLSVRAGQPLSEARLEALSERIPDADEAAAAAWMDALAQSEDAGALAGIRRWRLSRHDRLRRCWAQAELCLGGANGKADVMGRAEQDPAVILPAALAVGGAQLPVLRELASALSGVDACLALGVLGDARAVPVLLERLLDPLLADAAACALEILLGAAPPSTRREPDLDPQAPPREVACLSREPAAWQALADHVLEGQPATRRWRAGRPASVAATASLLGRLHLPLRVRRYLLRELRVRWNVRPGLDLLALLRQQSSALAALQAAPPAPQDGTWD